MRKHFDDRDYFVPRLQAYEERVMSEIASEQVTHPLHLYQPGSERLEKLFAAMELAQRFTWPSIITSNV